MQVEEFDHLNGVCNKYFNSFRDKRQLPKELELFYITKYQRTGDKKSLDVLVESCMSYVMVIAREFRNYDVQFSDLVQEGSIGLVLAIQKYDIASDIRLLTYAAYWIRAYMYEFIIKNVKIYKVASNADQRKLFFKIKKYRGDKSLSMDDIIKISKELNVSQHDVVEMERKLFNTDIFLDHLEHTDDDQSFATTFDTTCLTDYDSDLEDIFMKDDHIHNIVICVTNAVNKLPDKQKYIINNRILAENKSTLEAVGEHLDLTAERIRQLEKKAINTLRETLKPALAEIDYIV